MDLVEYIVTKSVKFVIVLLITFMTLGLFWGILSAAGGPLGIMTYVAKFSFSFGNEFVSSNDWFRFNTSTPYTDGQKAAHGEEFYSFYAGRYSEANYAEIQQSLMRKCATPECRKRINDDLRRYYEWKKLDEQHRQQQTQNRQNP